MNLVQVPLTERFGAEVIVPIRNKVGQFANNPILRDAVGGRNAIDPRRIMDEGRVVIRNLSKRVVGGRRG